MDIEHAVARYAPQGRFAKGWARGKMSHDPVYAAVMAYVPQDGVVVDVGCGEGYLLCLIAAAAPRVSLYGIDPDERRLTSGQQALGERVVWTLADARSVTVPDADLICVLDVLHYMPPADQDAVVARLARALKPGGLLVIREGHSGDGWRSWVSQWSERLTMALGRHRGDGVFFRPRAATEDAMRSAGLSLSVVPCQVETPFANMLFIGRRDLDRSTPPAGA